MVRVAEGIERRGNGLRLTIKYKGQTYRETDQGPGDAKHIRRVIKRREWLLSRLRVGLPILEEDVEKPTLGSLFHEWNDTRPIKHSSRITDANNWKNWWSRWNEYTPDVITTHMIREVLASRDVSPKTKKNALASLRGVLDYASINPNPCVPIKFGKRQSAPVDRYQPEEVDKLLSLLSGQFKVYFTLLAATGLRPSEALALTWSDFDGEQITVTKGVVRHRLEDSTKTYVRRKVLVPQWARATLNEHTTRFKGGYIFQNTKGSFHVDSDDFNAAWRRAHEKARIPYRIPYVLRHTRAAELLSTGSSEYALFAKQLGHSVEMFLRTYSEWIEAYSGKDLSALEGVRNPDGTHREPKGNVST